MRSESRSLVFRGIGEGRVQKLVESAILRWRGRFYAASRAVGVEPTMQKHLHRILIMGGAAIGGSGRLAL